jgi:O-antigen/teichoic acid export membrane protein
VIYNIISELFRTSDRFVILFMLGQETVGYYGIAIMVLGFSISIPAISREVVEPRLMESMDRADLARNLELYMTRPLMNTAYLMPFVIGPGILLLPFVIPIILPDYASGVVSAQILLLGGYFLAAGHVLRGVIVALGLQLKATIVAFPVLIVNIILSIMMVSWGYGIEGVALASSVSFLLMFSALFSFVWWQLRFRDHGLTKRFFWFFVPFPVMCTLLFFPDQLSVGLEESPMLFLSVKMLLFITLQGLLLHLVRTGGLVSFRIES